MESTFFLSVFGWLVGVFGVFLGLVLVFKFREKEIIIMSYIWFGFLGCEWERRYEGI